MAPSSPFSSALKTPHTAARRPTAAPEVSDPTPTARTQASPPLPMPPRSAHLELPSPIPDSPEDERPLLVSTREGGRLRHNIREGGRLHLGLAIRRQALGMPRAGLLRIRPTTVLLVSSFAASPLGLPLTKTFVSQLPGTLPLALPPTLLPPRTPGTLPLVPLTTLPLPTPGTPRPALPIINPPTVTIRQQLLTLAARPLPPRTGPRAATLDERTAQGNRRALLPRERPDEETGATTGIQRRLRLRLRLRPYVLLTLLSLRALFAVGLTR